MSFTKNKYMYHLDIFTPLDQQQSLFGWQRQLLNLIRRFKIISIELLFLLKHFETDR